MTARTSESTTIDTPLTVLNLAEAATAAALFERLFPADESGPGARQIGVVEYLDRALASHDAALVPVYKPFLAALDSASRSGHGSRFAELPAAQQDELLEALAAGGLPGPFDAEHQLRIFAQVRAHLQ